MEPVSDNVIATVAAAIVCATSPIAQIEIANQTGLSPKLVSRAAAWLEENDYVHRQASSYGSTGHPRQPLATSNKLQARCRTDRRWRRAVIIQRLCRYLELTADEVLDEALEELADQYGLLDD